VADASVIPAEVSAHAGATLYLDTDDLTTVETVRTTNGNRQKDPCYNLAGQRVDGQTRGLIICNGRLIINK